MSAIPTLVEALNRGLTVSFIYDEKPRLVEVHAVGSSTKDGAPLLRGYQVGGEASRKLPCWALFRVDDIVDAEIAMTASEAPRPGYAINDKQMREILVQLELQDA